MYRVDVYLRIRGAVMVEGMSMREAAPVPGHSEPRTDYLVRIKGNGCSVNAGSILPDAREPDAREFPANTPPSATSTAPFYT